MNSSLTTNRVQSIDVLRGLIVVLMAIDHVRVYSGLPAGGPEPGIFLTRWITHFCAPGFAFFAGTGAFLYGKKLGNISALSSYLFTRGLVLVALELTVIRFGWTFNFNFSEFTLAGVIWMLGWCMMLMAALVKLKPVTVGIIGLVIIFFQQAFGLVSQVLPTSIASIWAFVYQQGVQPSLGINILYVLVPWIGVMTAGYGFGLIVSMDAARRNKLCLQIGLSAIALYVVVGSILILTSTDTSELPFVFRLLSQQKYPASQLYLMMTLGPLIALIPWAERLKGIGAVVLNTFGRVPFFYYLLHIPLIHVSALIVNSILTGAPHQEFYNTAPFTFMPEEFRWSLSLLYLVFLIDIVILYFKCRWYVKYKFNHPEKKWLRFI